MIKTYQKAVELLNGLQTNANVLEKLRKQPRMNSDSIPEMRRYLKQLDISQQSIANLNVIHVAGTKGKGSTCAFVDSIINKQYKTGMFSSPHLLQVRERIRINGVPLEQDKFAMYFFQVYDKLQEPYPTYFRFLTLMAFHVFVQEKVQAAIVEVGIGGSYDSTNVIDRPTVCGITSLGLDHQQILGNSLAEIAWHKAGIMKPGVPCVSVEQDPEASKVLLERAAELGTSIDFVNTLPEGKLGLAGEHQIQNAALSVSLTSLWSRNTGLELNNVSQGLKNAKWPGRAHVVDNVYLDGAHTVDSIKACVEWFRQQLDQQRFQVLIFNCTMGRDASKLLEPLKQLKFKKVYFVPNTTKSLDLVNNMVKQDDQLIAQHTLKQLWGEGGEVYSSIDEAFASVQDEQVLVTGSLHLVGAVMTFMKLPVQ